MPDLGADLRYARLWLRRKCTVNGALSLQLLTKYADQAAATAQEEVQITGTTFEGGSAQFAAKFSKVAFATACEELLLEANPDAAREVDQTVAVFRRSTACA